MGGIRWGRLSLIGLVIALIVFCIFNQFLGVVFSAIGSLSIGAIGVFAILVWAFVSWGRNNKK